MSIVKAERALHQASLALDNADASPQARIETHDRMIDAAQSFALISIAKTMEAMLGLFEDRLGRSGS